MKDYFPHFQIALPRTQFLVIVKQGIKTFYHGCIGWRNNCWVKEVNDICNGRTKTFDLSRGKTTNFCEYLFLPCGRKNRLQERTKLALVDIIFVDVRNTEFWLPKEGMCCELHHGKCYYGKHRCIRKNVTFQ